MAMPGPAPAICMEYFPGPDIDNIYIPARIRNRYRKLLIIYIINVHVTCTYILQLHNAISIFYVYIPRRDNAFARYILILQMYMSDVDPSIAIAKTLTSNSHP